MQKVYIRKLNSQELGYRGGKAKKAGRYILVSKKCISYFPPLSEHIKNDHVFISIIPPNSNKSVLTNFVYHNSKIAENEVGGRDEFRIYLNKDNDPGRNFFKPDDIVIFHRLESRRPDDQEYIYRVYYFPVRTAGEHYKKLEKILASGAVSGSHAAVLVSSIPFVGLNLSPPSIIVVPQEVTEEAFKDPIIEETLDMDIFRGIAKNNSFREIITFFYNYQCAITRTSIRHGELLNVEAAHIIPRADKGGNNPTNGIALNRDLHWAFDKGFFVIDTDYKVLVHPKAVHLTPLKDLVKKTISLPQDKRAWPSKDCLEWRKKRFYGLFLKY